MLGAGDDRVTCIACGEDLLRENAREYDKLGDRWSREGKAFEYLCKPCFRGLSKHSRDGLEDVLDDLSGTGLSQEEFVQAFVTETRETAERD